VRARPNCIAWLTVAHAHAAAAQLLGENSALSALELPKLVQALVELIKPHGGFATDLTDAQLLAGERGPAALAGRR
jgi:hypothetical protein